MSLHLGRTFLPTRVFVMTAILAALCPAFAAPARAGIGVVEPSVQLFAGDGVAGDEFGTAMSFSENTLVVGSPYGSGVGAAYIFTGSGASWTQMAKLTASDGSAGSQFGFSVAIVGNTVAVGAPMQSGGGAVYVFVEPATGWVDMSETAKLTNEGDGFGYSVAFGGGGKFLATGTSFQNAAYVFAKPSSGWVSAQVPTANLVAPPYATGFGTALTASGLTVVVGAHTANNESGAAYVFLVQPGVANINSIAALTASDAESFLGESLAMAGNTVVAVAEGRDYIFVQPATGWADMTETAELTTDHPQTALGIGVALSNGVIFCGATVRANGYVVDYVKPITGWVSSSSPNTAFVPSVASSWFGESVAFNGTTLAAGDSSFNQSQGTVYIFAH